MLDFIGTIITAALMMLVVNALITFMDVSRTAKVTLAAVIGVWIGFAAAAAGAGWIAISRPFPLVGLFVAAPLLAAALATAWPAARRAMLSIPMPVMVAVNIVRVLGVLFLMLAAEGRLTGPFPYSAAWGDIITGIAAVPGTLARDGREHTPRDRDCGLEPVRRRRSRTGDRLWRHVGGALARAAFPRPGLRRDAVCALVLRPDRARPNLADSARAHRGAAPARQSWPTRDRRGLMAN